MTDRTMAATTSPEEFLADAMAWHFDAKTGSRFWLQEAMRLDFDPRTDIRTFEDLKRFPDLTSRLREVPVRDLIPQGYGEQPEVIGVFDSGGTTGPPKRVVLLRDFCDVAIEYVTRGYRRNTSWLSILPSGPHIGAEYTRRQVTALGGLLFSIDMDPRWVKRLIAAGRGEEAEAYAEHLVDQASHVLRGQEVDVLSCTPPLLERLCRRDELVELVREKVEAIEWGGAHMDADTRHLYRAEIFPDAKLIGVWGSTMALGLPLTERADLADDDPCIYDPFSPYVTVEVVDPETREQVGRGDRGQLLVHCVTRSFFLPNNLERDMATRMEAPAGEVGDSFADVTPVPTFEGGTVIEGVY